MTIQVTVASVEGRRLDVGRRAEAEDQAVGTGHEGHVTLRPTRCGRGRSSPVSGRALTLRWPFVQVEQGQVGAGVRALAPVMVTAADTGDRTAAEVLLAQVADAHHLLELVWADGGYTGALIAHCLTVLALMLTITNAATTRRGSWYCRSGGSSSGSPLT